MDKLHKDLYEEIFKYISPYDILKLSFINKYCYKNINNESIWKEVAKREYIKHLYHRDDWYDYIEEDIHMDDPPESITLRPGHMWKDVVFKGLYRSMNVNDMYHRFRKLLPKEKSFKHPVPFNVIIGNSKDLQSVFIIESWYDLIKLDSQHIFLSIFNKIFGQNELDILNKYGYILYDEIMINNITVGDYDETSGFNIYETTINSYGSWDYLKQ